MKYIGSIQSIPDSSNDNITHLLNGKSIDLQLPGSSSVWATGYVINHSFVSKLIVNFYNSRREAQSVIIPPRHKFIVKNQNCDRLQISISILDNFAAYSYKLSLVESETNNESSYLLVYANQQLDPLIGDNDLVTKPSFFDITAAGGPVVIQTLENRQMRVKNITMSVLPSTLPATQPTYDTAVEIAVNEIDDSSSIVESYPYHYFFHNFWRDQSDRSYALTRTGTAVQVAGLELSIADAIGTVTVRVFIDLQTI